MDDEWLVTEAERVRAGLEAARPGAEALATAAREEAGAQEVLNALRRERRKAVEPLGDTLNATALGELITDAGVAARQAEERYGQLEAGSTALNGLINDLVAQMNKLAGEAQAARKNTIEKSTAASAAQTEMEDIRSALGAPWAEVMEDRAAFDRVQLEVKALRPIAGRLGELDRAQGRLDEIQSEIERVEAETESVLVEHRIPEADAAQREDEARTTESAAIATRDRAAGDLAGFEERRRREAELSQEINAADSERSVFSELADLLKEGGSVQVWVAQREQQQIVREANAVLGQLGDPLRFVLGEPRRRQQNTQLQDVLVQDMGDPLTPTRYFEFLSGGEQFRVALSLALALHRSVNGGSPGTIVVDEGFGALDEHRRDALALQLTDASQGILRLGLAHSIIICSHSGEVQRHFPYRWLVTKQGGSATVCRPA